MARNTTWDDLLRPGNAASFFDRDPLPPFDPAATAFSAVNAWWLAELCRLVYRHDIEEASTALVPARSSFLARAGLRQIDFFDTPDAGTGFVVQSTTGPQFSALVFRGTEQNVVHYWRDIDTVTIAFAGGAGDVHRGFFTAFDKVWAEVARALDQVSGPVFYAGHSLGAAIATLAAARRPPTALYTFGSPRVGDEAFVTAMSKVNAYRVVHGHDPVASVPPEIIGFRHVGELYQLERSHEPASIGELVDSINPLAGPPRPLDDHALVHYLDGLLSWPAKAAP